MKQYLVVGLFGALLLIDMWPVNKRYLDKDNFERKKNMEVPFEKSFADEKILEDQALSYRVFYLGEQIDKSARTAYFHKSIAGYHGAKFRRFQELVDYQLTPERDGFVQLLSNQPDNFALNVALRQLKNLNMLNTKYIIYDLNSEPLVNYNALGNAWFVNEHMLVRDADEEITALNNYDPATQAIVDQRFNDQLAGYEEGIDSTGYILLNGYTPKHLTYDYKLDRDQMTIFSEIYYDKGWNAYIDGEIHPHFRANWLLRGMVLPAGEHTLEFKFEPRSYFISEKVSMAASWLLLLVIIGGLVREFMLYRKKESQTS